MQIEAVQDAVLSNAEVLKSFNEAWASRQTRGHETDSQGVAESGQPGNDKKAKSDETKDSKDGKKEKRVEDKPSSNYATMQHDLNAYFSAAQKAEIPALPDYSTYPQGSTLELVKKLHRFKLTKAETIMILNLKPRDAITLDILIEELDDRFPDTGPQQGEMLEIIGKVLTGAGEADLGKLRLDDQDTEAVEG